MNETMIILDEYGKIKIRGFYNDMIPHYLRIIADKLETVPAGVVDITWEEDLLLDGDFSLRST